LKSWSEKSKNYSDFFQKNLEFVEVLKKIRKLKIEYFLVKKKFQKFSKKNSEIFQKLKKAQITPLTNSQKN
jgi:hypothetical protein